MKVYKANNGKKKISAVAICLLLTVVMTVGGTLAWLVATSDSVTNTFTPASAPNEIQEEMNGTVKSNVKVSVAKNDKNVDVYIRVAMVATWQDGQGNIAPVIPVADTDYTVVMSSNNWVEKDGFYYYKKVVTPGTSTENLFDSITVVEGKAPAGYTLHIELLSQSIQAEGVDSNGTKPVVLAWGVDPSGL